MFRAICPISMPNAARLGFRGIVVCGLTMLSLGCGSGPQAEFKFRDTTEDLISNANKAVKDTLAEDFGSPSHLVARERFPIAYGGTKGKVESVTDTQSIIIKLDNESAKVPVKASVLWLTGSLAGKNSDGITVASYHAESSQLKLEGASTSPAVGDQFVVAFGQDLQLGRQVYMKNCLHCHGVSGDGAGPTGEFLNPRPRDYRNGTFKFTGTKSGEKATRDDLTRVVKYGIPGTYMPSFLLLGERETASVIEYVRWLAIRGNFEKLLVSDLSNEFSQKAVKDSVKKAAAAYEEEVKTNPKAPKPPSEGVATKTAKDDFARFLTEDYAGAVELDANIVADAWVRAELNDTLVIPTVRRVDDTPESRERGRLLYMSNKTNCFNCHGMTGRGDGLGTEDFWPKLGSKDPNEKYPHRGLHDEWGNKLQPRDLTKGQYRGGRRPLDIYRRVSVGIKGTPMPGFGSSLTEPQIWDIVNFVMSLPYTSGQSTGSSAARHVVTAEEKPAH